MSKEAFVSEDTKKLLQELASEHRLSMLQFRGLFEHLNPNSEKRTPVVDQNSRPRPKPKRFRLDGLAALRKKEDIIRRGGYERDTFVPPSGKVISEKEKDRLIYFLAYGCDRPPTPPLAQVVAKNRPDASEYVLSPKEMERQRRDELMDEIEDRMNFLEEMKNFGASKNYEQTIRQEIAKKFKELKMIE